MRVRTGLFVFIAAAQGTLAIAKTGLQGTIGHQSVFFADEQRTRHHRYFLDLKQNTDLLPYKLSTVLDGRFQADMAVSPEDAAPDWNFDKAVRDDEYLETMPRQAYVDYVTDSTQTKVGLQQIDWIESLAQNVSNILTPLDLRYGGFGASNDLIRPVGALNFNHKFISGSVDWLLVTHPQNHRTAKGDNAYGYYETLSSLVGGAEFELKEDKTNAKRKEIETGLRYSMNLSSFNLTFIGYRGHNRSPIFRATALTPQSFQIEESHPFVNTYVVSGSMSDDALVVRALVLHQPKRPISYSIGTPVTLNVPPEASQQHTRFVAGLDYAMSKHLKFYSETIYSQTQTVPADFYKKNARKEPSENDYASSVRLTNESMEEVIFTLDGTFTGPEKSSAVTFQGEWTFAGAYKFNLGGRRISAKDPESSFYSIRNTSQYFLSLEHSFNEKSFQ